MLYRLLILFVKSLNGTKQSFYKLRRDNPNSSIYNKNKVYAVCKEYKFIETFLNKNEFNKKIHNAIYRRKFNSYNFSLNRIDVKYRIEFLQKFKEDFKNITNKDLEFFNNNQKLELKVITQNPNITIKENNFLNKNSFIFIGILFCTILLIFILIKIKRNKNGK